MQIVVLADALQKEELLAGNSLTGVTWVSSAGEFLLHKTADAFVDLQYINEESRNALLGQLLPAVVIINSVADTLSETDSSFVRINGWNTFLSSPLVEAAGGNPAIMEKAEAVFSVIGKKPEWIIDQPGFVTARVVCMIINEAFIALAEGVSTKEDINTAMKLGTAYPYGPFEWAEKIGVQNIVTLLQKLSQAQGHYTPAELLAQDAAKSS